MEPSYPVIRGQTNPPRSSRLVNRHSPLPSQNRILMIRARLPRKANRWPQNGYVARHISVHMWRDGLCGGGAPRAFAFNEVCGFAAT